MSLEMQHLNKFYGKTQALNDVTVTFESEKIYGLLGRNGAGKTTLLNLIANRIFTPYGNILLDGEEIEENDKALSKLFLVNSDNLYPKHMTVEKAFRLTKAFTRNLTSKRHMILQSSSPSTLRRASARFRRATKPFSRIFWR